MHILHLSLQCSLSQKKAEEAHKVLEGLGPKVELVSKSCLM